MTALTDIENLAGIARITCGWKKPELPLSRVRRYWREVHSSAISRRAGIYDYRHYQYDEVDPSLFGAAERAQPIAPLVRMPTPMSTARATLRLRVRRPHRVTRCFFANARTKDHSESV